MPSWLVVLLRIATASLFLGEAWLHWFGDTSYAVALQDPLLQWLSVEPLWLDRGLGALFFAAGLLAIWWQPRWIVGLVLILSLVGLAFVAFCWGLASTSRVATHTGNAVLIFTPLILLLGGIFRLEGLSKFLLRLLFTVSFATFGILALGLQLSLGPVQLGSEQFDAWIQTVDAAIQLPIAAPVLLRGMGVLCLLACIGLWIKPAALPSAAFFALAGLTSSVAVIASNPPSSDFVESLHRLAPEVLLRAPFMLLGIALVALQVVGWSRTRSGSGRFPFVRAARASD